MTVDRSGTVEVVRRFKDRRRQQDNAPAPAAQPAYKVVKREKDRWGEVRDRRGELVCVTAYKRAVEVVRRLAA